MPVALGEPHLELIALAEDHQVRVAVGSRIAAGMRTEKDDASHGGVRCKFIDEPLDRLLHPANLPPVTPSAWLTQTTWLFLVIDPSWCGVRAWMHQRPPGGVRSPTIS